MKNAREGWAAGLQLAALAMKRTSDIDGFVQTFSGSNRYVMDYLADEVLASLSDEETTFLLQTSILDEMCADLCDAIIGRTGSQEQLEQLEALNLFIIPLDNERKWYRYHHLFANLLQLRLSKHDTLNPKQLHKHAAAWLENDGQVDVAIRHLKQAHDIDGIVSIIKRHIRQYVMTGRIGQVWTWLNLVPEETTQSNYYLARWMGWMYYFRQQPDQTAIWANFALASLEKADSYFN